MSDEMVQEKTTTEEALSENGAAPGHSEETTPLETVSAEAVVAMTAAEEPTPTQPDPTPIAAAEAPAPAPADMGEMDAFEREMKRLTEMEAQYQKSFNQLEADRVVQGTVMRIDREVVLVDVGAKSEGIIRLNELTREQNVVPEQIVQVGEKIWVYVLEPENRDGIPVLSKKRADFELAWETVEKARQTGEVIQAMVTDRVKGGLVVDLGVRGFVPASHVGTGSLKTNLDKYVGQSIPLKVIEVDRKMRKVVLSNKQAVDEEKASRMAETKASLEAGQIRRGTVRRLTNYGAFIDLGGIDGLLHISEMSWTRIEDPKDILREGQDLDVLILKLDLEKNRVSLGLRQILPDPWQEIGTRYNEGQIIHGVVTRMFPFGAFVRLDGEEIEGVIPSSELPRIRGAKGAATLNVNDEVEAKIIGLKPGERKMTLSMRVLQPAEEVSPAAPREPMAEVGTATGGGSAGGTKRNKRGRDRDAEDDGGYSRYSGRSEEPRFTIGDAIAAKRERTRRERRTEEEETTEDYDYTLDEAEVEAEEETPATPETEEQA